MAGNGCVESAGWAAGGVEAKENASSVPQGYTGSAANSEIIYDSGVREGCAPIPAIISEQLILFCRHVIEPKCREICSKSTCKNRKHLQQVHKNVSLLTFIV